MKTIIVVDDDPLAAKILVRMLEPSYQVHSFGDGSQALRFFSQHGADIILTDLKMPKMNGLELLTKAKDINPEVIVFMITGYSSIDSAVEAIKKGAYDYISKPFDPDAVLLRVARVLKERELESRVQVFDQERQLSDDKYTPLTNHPKMLKVLELAKKVARTDSNVLIEGETGVGKELVARVIHRWSPRREEAFVPINCSALSDGILESELFGHEKGAFTGAVQKRIGYFEQANGGSILLDEIGTTDNGFQVKLLRVLQDRMICRVGSTVPLPIDARIIASTNQNLEQEARNELFRSDLYFRLSVVTLRVPPLRERIEDIPLLVDHFLEKYRHINPQIENISASALQQLARYDYPGNVRELENIIERAMILESGTVLGPDCLLIGQADNAIEPQNSLADQKPAGGEYCMEDLEREHILQVLERCQGKKKEAAEVLGINKTTLWRKLKKYGVGA